MKNNISSLYKVILLEKTKKNSVLDPQKGNIALPHKQTTIQTQGESFKFILISHNSKQIHGRETRQSSRGRAAEQLAPSGLTL